MHMYVNADIWFIKRIFKLNYATKNQQIVNAEQIACSQTIYLENVHIPTYSAVQNTASVNWVRKAGNFQEGV